MHMLHVTMLHTLTLTLRGAQMESSIRHFLRLGGLRGLARIGLINGSGKWRGGGVEAVSKGVGWSEDGGVDGR